MPKPESVTQVDTDRWYAHLVAVAATDTNCRFMLGAGGDIVERVWYTGSWLIEQLRADGCPEQLQEICARLLITRVSADIVDPWEVAESTLREYRVRDGDRMTGLSLVSWTLWQKDRNSANGETFAAKIGYGK